MCSERAFVAVTLGNELRGDDGAGILFGRMVKERELFTVIEGGGSPENITGLIVDARPEIVLIVDALDFGGRPGDFVLLPGERLEGNGVSTHASLSLFVDYLRYMTDARILILGFQPRRIGIGEELSEEVCAGVVRAVEAFARNKSLRKMLVSSA